MMIQTVEQLKEVMDEVREAGVVALDTEFVWERTYYAQLGLVQLGLSRDRVFLIDPVALKDLSLLGEVIADPGVVKILHDAVQDLMILRRATGGHDPKNIFDSRTAAGFVGLSSTLSLRDLVYHYCKISLNKTQTRTNWVRRPLSEQQIEYAKHDVYYLPEIRERLIQEAEAAGRLSWLKEEMQGYDNADLYGEGDQSNLYKKVKGRGKMSSKDLAVLQELAVWRESEAKKQDRPRSHVIGDDVLIKLVRQSPKKAGDIEAGRGLSSKDAGRYSEGMVNAVQKGLKADPSSYVSLKSASQESEQLLACVDFALAFMKGKGLKEGMDHSLVASRAEVVSMVRSHLQSTQEFLRLQTGWRYEFLGQELENFLKGQGYLKIDPDLGLPVRVEK